MRRGTYGVRTSQKAYNIEAAKYPECRFNVELNSIREILETLSGAFDVKMPTLKFRRMSRTSGQYRSSTQTITISSEGDLARFSTIVHEFAHHLNYVKNSRGGHDEYFLAELAKAYAVAKERYHGTIERHSDQAESLQERDNNRREELQSNINGFRIGQRVEFTARYGKKVRGTVASRNRKTITIKDCDDGNRGWRVSPHLLKIVEMQYA